MLQQPLSTSLVHIWSWSRTSSPFFLHTFGEMHLLILDFSSGAISRWPHDPILRWFLEYLIRFYEKRMFFCWSYFTSEKWPWYTSIFFIQIALFTIFPSCATTDSTELLTYPKHLEFSRKPKKPCLFPTSMHKI